MIVSRKAKSPFRDERKGLFAGLDGLFILCILQAIK